MIFREAEELQQKAVKNLFSLVMSERKTITFRAPTGTGKTHMMADMMNRVLEEDEKVVFMVSTLSKGGLAEQNYTKFIEYRTKGEFPKLKPYLINTVVSGEESLFIPTDFNVYILPRDLYKKNGKLMEGPMQNFLTAMTEDYFGQGKNMKIYLVRDECHIETKNVNEVAEKLKMKTINFSATPNLKRNQFPDVEITEQEAVRANLIKEVIYKDVDDTEHLDEAIKLLKKKKDEYKSLGINPCMIIQVSNEDKVEYEWNNIIKKELDKPENNGLLYMYIVSDEKKCKTNYKVGSMPVSRWKEYAKGNESGIDIIIFKMTYTEGVDIPRACILYQIRATRSKQLDEQVIGRVRRNPCLQYFDKLTPGQKTQVLEAYVWAEKKERKEIHPVKLWNAGKDVVDRIKIKTIKLKEMDERDDFDISTIIDSGEKDNHSIFQLYKQLNSCDEKINKKCYEYAGNDIDKWFQYAGSLSAIKKAYKDFECNYQESMIVDKVVSFPAESSYMGETNNADIYSWVWLRSDGDNSFAFDSDAERRWASLMNDFCRSNAEVVNDGEEEKFLWGKNYPINSEIRYQYYSSGIHSSYPDFIMKDKHGRIHIFEVKSLNESTSSNFDKEEYEKKIEELKKCYLHCSAKLDNHYFYIPVLEECKWRIYTYRNGEEDKEITTTEELKKFIKE